MSSIKLLIIYPYISCDNKKVLGQGVLLIAGVKYAYYEISSFYLPNYLIIKQNVEILPSLLLHIEIFLGF